MRFDAPRFHVGRCAYGMRAERRAPEAPTERSEQRPNCNTERSPSVPSTAYPSETRIPWDRELPGFGVRVYPSGAKVYVAQCRADGKSRRITLGRHGVISADQARRKAALAIARIKGGEAPDTVTVAALAERYLKEYVAVHCKPSSAKLYRRVLDKFILPAYGILAVEAVEREHVSALHYRLRNIPYQANRVLEIESKIFNLAELWGLRREDGNPCRFVRKYKERKRERFLSDEEFRRLGEVLNGMEGRCRLTRRRQSVC